MEIDPKVLRELIETFKIELHEQLQIITEALLYLEKNHQEDTEFFKKIDAVFRAAHNMKGASRGLGIDNVGKIFHHLETLFSNIKNKKILITPDIVDLCLESVDALNSAMRAFINHEKLPFDLDDLAARLDSDNAVKAEAAPINKHYSPNDEQNNASTTIRVSLEALDQISALMEEIQVNKISMDENYLELNKISFHIQKLTDINKHISTEGFVDKNLQKIMQINKINLDEINVAIRQLLKSLSPHINEFAMLSNSLQNEFRTLRLVPASELLRTFPRSVRDLAHELNKQVELEIKGEDVKIDKMILDGLKDPLIHLLRNAIDHGIEPVETRKKQGKPDAGHVRIQITEEGNQVLIIVQDDGAGIDVKKITEVAEKKNILSHAELENMNKDDCLEVIFKPGFSTKEIITDVSGRGIGLNVVKENLENLKGNVSVQTELGKGTTFLLRVPLTLTSERGLMITCGGDVYAIPISHIEKVLTLTAQQIVDVSASQAIILDKHPIPLRSLANILHVESAELLNKEKYAVIVLKKTWQTAAILVDEIKGEKEIVIKPLQAPLSNSSFFAGGTLAANGKVILVLNTNTLIDMALHTQTVHRVNVQDDSQQEKIKPKILVVDDSITTRTMEKNVLEYKNYDVMTAVNGKEAWDLLQKENFSLLITDASMPVMDGFTLTEKVKQSPSLSKLPVIIVTSLDSPAEKKRGIDAGANAYVVKNEFESDALIKIVEQLI